MTQPAEPAVTGAETPPAAPTAPVVAAVVAPQNSEAIAPERVVPPTAVGVGSEAKPETPKPAFSPEQQTYLDQLLARTRDEARTRTEKTAEERIAELEKKYQADQQLSEARAVNAIVARAIGSSTDPELAELVLRSRLGNLTSENEAEILALGQTIFTEKPALAPAAGAAAAAPAPLLTPTPGVQAANNGQTFLTADQRAQLTPEQLAADPDLMKKYVESLNREG